MPNYQFLHTFLQVYRLGSQTKAAAALFLTQPAVFQQLRHLEEQIGRPLFTRVGKHIEPTAAAHQLALKMGHHLDGIAEAWDGMDHNSTSIKGVVHIGAIAEFVATCLAPYLAEHLDPGLEIRFTTFYERPAERLLKGELDLAQFIANIGRPGIEIETLFEQENLVVGSPKFKAEVKSGKQALASLENLPWLAYSESLLFIRDYFRNVFDHSFAGGVRLMIPDLWSLKAAAIGGLGVTVLPSYFCADAIRDKKLSVLYVAKKRQTHRFYLGWKMGALRNPRIQAARLALRAAVERQDAQGY